MPHKKPPTFSNHFLGTIKWGALFTGAGTLIGIVWGAAVYWTNLQTRLSNIEDAQKWQTQAIRALVSNTSSPRSFAESYRGYTPANYSQPASDIYPRRTMVPLSAASPSK
jgi:hypothetical protein